MVAVLISFFFFFFLSLSLLPMQICSQVIMNMERATQINGIIDWAVSAYILKIIF